MWDLYYCTDDVDFSTITALTPTNQVAVKAELDGYNFATVGHINDFSIAHSLQNEEIIRAGNCGVGELARLVEKTPTITFTRLDVNNRPVFDKMLGLDLLNVAGVLVAGATYDVVNPSGYDVFFKIPNQNGDGSALTINSVTGDVDWLLTVDVDYKLVIDGNGNSGIILISGTNITTLTQTFTVDYDYTPSASSLDGYNIEKNTVPYGLYKFVSCKNPINSTQGIQDTIYFRKYVLNGDLTENYIFLSEDSTFEGTEASFVGVSGGGYLKQKATVTL